MPNRSNFKIHSILLVKNEEDVIEECLKEASRWSDFIYVYDGVSTDDTWKIVTSMKNSCIVPFRQDSAVFREGLRADVFNAFKGSVADGDWWCQLNADEFYIDDVRQFLGGIVAPRHVVWGTFVQYYLTQPDVDKLDFDLPCSELLPLIRYYLIDHAERRFFRHRNGLVWDSRAAWPPHLGLSEERLIRFKHYPYRSPRQIQMRLDVRRDNRERGFEGWKSASQLTWQEKIVDHLKLHYDERDGNYIFDPSLLPDHLGPRARRLFQHAMHTLGIWP